MNNVYDVEIIILEHFIEVPNARRRKLGFSRARGLELDRHFQFAINYLSFDSHLLSQHLVASLSIPQ